MTLSPFVPEVSMVSRSRLWLVSLACFFVGGVASGQGWRTTPYAVQDPAGVAPAIVGDRAGARLVVLGDVNGDGADDLAVGAPAASIGALSDAGRIEVRSGSDLSLIHTVNGTAIGQGLGETLTRVSDLDGDGVDDLAAGLAAGPTRPARVAWISSATGLWLGTVPLGGTTGTRSHPVVRAWRDFNGDGASEYAVAGLRDGSGAASLAIVDRVLGLAIMAVALPVVDAAVSWTRPDALIADEDLDGDGIVDLVLGLPHARLGAAPLAGDPGVVMLLGGPGLSLRWLRSGLTRDAAFGASLLTVPDLDADDHREVLVGEPGVAGAAGQLIALSGASGSPVFALSSSATPVLGLGGSLARHRDGIFRPDSELVVAGCAPLPGSGVMAVGFVFGRFPALPVQSSGLYAVDPSILPAAPRTVVATGGDFDRNGLPDLVLGIDAQAWSTSVHWFRTAGSFSYGTQTAPPPALGLEGAFQSWRVQGGLAGASCLCVVGLRRAVALVAGTPVHVDLTVPGSFLFWTAPFDPGGRASFVPSPAAPLPLIPGLTLHVQAFSTSANPAGLLASNGLQITL